MCESWAGCNHPQMTTYAVILKPSPNDKFKLLDTPNLLFHIQIPQRSMRLPSRVPPHRVIFETVPASSAEHLALASALFYVLPLIPSHPAPILALRSFSPTTIPCSFLTSRGTFSAHRLSPGGPHHSRCDCYGTNRLRLSFIFLRRKIILLHTKEKKKNRPVSLQFEDEIHVS